MERSYQKGGGRKETFKKNEKKSYYLEYKKEILYLYLKEEQDCVQENCAVGGRECQRDTDFNLSSTLLEAPNTTAPLSLSSINLLHQKKSISILGRLL